jgi:hypothetical protein
VWHQLPVAVERWAAPSMTCADCAFFDAERGWCGARNFTTRPTLPSCEFFDARRPEGR